MLKCCEIIIVLENHFLYLSPRQRTYLQPYIGLQEVVKYSLRYLDFATKIFLREQEKKNRLITNIDSRE